MVNPSDLVLGGWDICADDLGTAMRKAKVLEPDLQNQLLPFMSQMKPLPSVYIPSFIAANQASRANNLLRGSLSSLVAQIREQIRTFKSENELETVIVLWTATTERFTDVQVGVHDTAANLLRAIEQDHTEISPSTLFAVACIEEGVPFINGAPQNTLIDGVVDLATARKVFVAGDDFKSGQTKLKSVLVDFLISSGIKPLAITSYNHLGNNDGLNLSAPAQFFSKETSKSNVVDDMVQSNSILYPDGKGPDHTVVIKYVPSVGDSKRAMDEYFSEIGMGGRSTLAIHNTCEDSLLAAPLILDLVILTELFTRITWREVAENSEWKGVNPVLSFLSFFLKAPNVPKGMPVVNALGRQRRMLEELCRACLGLDAVSEMPAQL